MKKMKQILIFLSLILVLAMPFEKTAANDHLQSTGAVYYVDNVNSSASDSNPGSEALPWKTIQHAANVVAAGDTVNVKTGTYPERINLAHSGSAGKRITFQAFPRRSVTMWGFYTAGADFLRISGFNITTNTSLTGWTDQNGVFIRSNDVEVIDNYFFDLQSAAITGYWHAPYPQRAYLARNTIYNSQMGIVITGYDWLVELNEVSRLRQYNSSDSDYSRFFGDNHVIRKNYFHGTLPAEIGSAHVDCFQTFDNNGEFGHNILFDGNWCSEFHQGLMAEAHYFHNISNLTFMNNVFVHGWAWGLCVQDISYLTAVNNTFVDIAYHGIGLSGNSHHGTVKNNIFYDMETSYWVQDTSTIDGDYNLIYKAQTPPVKGLHDKVGIDPLFINPSADNFHLPAQSPAVDAGLGIPSVNQDYDRLSRPQSGAWDIGAFEYQPPLILSASSGDKRLYLSWQLNVPLSPSVTWQISFTPPNGTPPPQITGIAIGTRSFDLVGLNNYILYTVTLTAMDGSTPLLSAAIQGMPSNIHIFFSMIAN